jgi:hypothetical protein
VPNAELARLGVTGALRVAPVGTTAPADMAAWPPGWGDLGYISDDGITESRDEDQEQFVPWQAYSPIRVETTRSVETFAATLWETNFQTVSLFYGKGAGDMTTSGGVVSFTTGVKPKRQLRAFGIDVVDGVYKRRLVAPYAEVTARGDLVYQSSSLIGYEVTITAYPGTDGVAVLRMFDEGWKVPSNEVQRATISGTPTGGTFTLTYSGQSTGAIAYNATSAAVVTALEGLSNIGAGDVTATGGPLPGTAVDVTFTGALGGVNVAQMTATSSLTGGTTPAVTVTTVTEGGA